jgi:Peroxisomal biogenesis factor 11 (PEX11)
MIGDVRTTLRLTGLLPLYVLLKSLLAKDSPKRKDAIAYNIALIQCLAYIGFQALENVYHLTSKTVLPPDFVAKRGGIPKFVLWSCRSWLVGVAVDFLRLAREAQLHQERKDRGEKISESEQKAFDRQWWASLQTDVAWMPVAVHYSVEGGLSWMNTGLVGFCGMMAYMNNFRNAWAATKE